jgi:large subunit ribosomal protein L41
MRNTDGVYRRLQLTAKQGRNFYKGNRVGSLGDWTKRGVYKIDYKKVRTYVVPKDLHNTDVISSNVVY